MLKTFAIFLVSSILSLAHAATSVRYYTDVDFYSTNAGASYLTLNVETSGDGSSSTAPHVAYLPIRDASDNQLPYFTFAGATNKVPQGNGTTLTGTLRVNLKTTNSDGADRYLYLAVLDSGSAYQIATTSMATIGQVTDQTTTADLNLNNLCDSGITQFNCTDFNTTTAQKEITLYYFLSDSSTLVIGDPVTIDSSNNTGGVFLKLKISQKINSSATLTLTDLRPGDKQLTAIYSGTSITNLKRIVACINGGANTVQALGCTFDNALLKDVDSTSLSAEVKIKELTNSLTYSVSVGIEDKFQMATFMSNALSATPLAIEALLAKNQCYILSAGFQEEHPVVEYYKHIRDHYLKHFFLGKMFISWYYKTAPQYTSYIIASPKVAYTIRVLATAGFYFSQMIFPIMVCLFGLYLIRKRKA
ncbi:MAG: hypothetical protein COW00_01660 [Bdellovibrio sp. CG12_big_fil_rev_8_21_14_0_65_39_13]|nr:MAG: hypothetical protein COW78_03410 [Bdellovibrio sp. CG22_combo_CG10-13_8_21_14_all_39_27]PIQ62416.1 MAG: hypothetical protein COW00_01660 [Bdellovibrio sp. CG12_big_fil_rev_8_21_14_0_65_39_13]PIR34083.1 MAG: hypothetical protein COV37_14140 [Bdellovibrio sp. CG11_big_fil_rev_8_21_14_0_20_39_38]PJB52977.1 MAG: hypothetical protein CO099_09735 [Bdellovibrio sp. CG_4_9_14_3_um_filter_39_7]